MPVFLHAAHEVRQAFDGLQLITWLAIGIGFGAVALSWGRLVAWIREPESRPPAVQRWGEDDIGWYFEIARPGTAPWYVAMDGVAAVLLVAALDDGRLLRPASPLPRRPSHLVSSSGVRLSL